MYKAKFNIVCGEKNFSKGTLYSAQDIAGLDLNDFDFIGGSAPVEVETKEVETPAPAETPVAPTEETSKPAEEVAPTETAPAEEVKE